MSRDIWAIVPVKEIDGAKQRLAEFLDAPLRRELTQVMIGEVLAALAGVAHLAGIMVVTIDPTAIRLAGRIGARIVREGARDGHTGSVAAGQAILSREGRDGMLALPGDIPCVTSADLDAVLGAHLPAPSFTIVPAHDDLGSNAVICSPPDAVTLRFGENSFFPHLEASRALGIVPTVMRLPGIALDIDHPADLAALLRSPHSVGTRTRAMLEAAGVPRRLEERGIS